MITIIIKSFNRPYYLDRCLQSIYTCVKGNFEIKILDDGTPKKYLDLIQLKYPNVNIITSNQYLDKIQAIENNINNGNKIDGFTIPTDLWYNEVKSSSDYVLVTEDDVWFTKFINIDEVVREMKSFSIPLLKLGWLGNYSDDKNLIIDKLSDDLNQAQPQKLFTSNKFIMDMFMYNKYKFFTVLYKLGLVDNKTKRKYWSLNSILMGLYQKDYWLAIWADAKGKVDEKQQLRNAAAWYYKNKKAIFARTNQEVLKTTFKSSATGSYHEYGNHFDVNRMNYILNEAWLNNEFDAMQNYPKDFSDDYIKSFLDKENHPDAQYDEWYKWAEKFRQQYRNLGAEVE
ncbi:MULTISPECIES: glycosyltransferase family 2 protein [Empedobacter]|uniref:glycosyltransferase family 2 protein n=1 Tax=Empedobacter TaxID=59734 RepID=UPI002574CFCA|nr:MULTISPECIES: glycosyltransferase family 2 protein [Empedobacter]MDM1040625.1 glycosyltransferase family 2 protein [Empedobacter brevis]MDM1135600.1 glycosyltransferase family 2 protein [Empedobacter sp. R750]